VLICMRSSSGGGVTVWRSSHPIRPPSQDGGQVAHLAHNKLLTEVAAASRELQTPPRQLLQTQCMKTLLPRQTSSAARGSHSLTHGTWKWCRLQGNISNILSCQT